ncbi:MAG: hypothetical protein ACXW1M_08995 [Acidimicrobiia bacterium]
MRRVAARLVVGTLVATMLVVTASPVSAGEPEIKPEPPTLDDTVELALADVEEFWTKNMKRAYPGVRYEPIDTLLPYDAENWAEVGTCGTYVPTAYEENAFYCEIEDKIVWDIGTWFPRLYSDISYLTIVAILAHEWGHAVQDQGGLSNDSPSILFEQSADCFSGVYLRFLADGKSKRFPAISNADLDAMVAITLQISDPIGRPTEASGAHGSPYDRVNAIQEGFEKGPRRCARYDTDAPATLDLEFTDPDDAATGGNLDIETITSLVQTDLDDFWSNALTKYQPVALVVPYDVDTVERLPQCGDEVEPREAFRNVLFYCADGNFVAWDNIILEEAHATYGDFAVATLLANQWSGHVQDLLGVPFSLATGAHKVCLTGAYIGNVYRQSRPTAQLRLSAGDLDEAIQVQLNYGQFKGKDFSVFEKMAALRRGFFDGADACDQLLPKRLRP